MNGEVLTRGERVRYFVLRLLKKAQDSNDLEYIRSNFFTAYGAMSFVLEEEYNAERYKELLHWWDEVMSRKFYELMIER